MLWTVFVSTLKASPSLIWELNPTVLKGTLDFGLKFLSQAPMNLYGFLDSNWVGCPTTWRSTIGYCIFLGENCISWSSKKQMIVAHSSVEVEYRFLASTCAKLTRITFLLRDVDIHYSNHLNFTNNMGSLNLSKSPMFHARTKHIKLNYHFIEKMWQLDHSLLDIFLLHFKLLIYSQSLFHATQPMSFDSI